jgi:hydroxypyruvate reductase
MNMSDPELFLRDLFDVAVRSALPSSVIQQHLPDPQSLGSGRLLVIGAGKASAAMAKAAEDFYDRPLEGLVITRYGHAVACRGVKVVEASHPVPDQAGLEATQDLLKQLQGLTAQDTVLALISGGGSALLTAPVQGLSLSDKQQLTQDLLRSGANIVEMNTVRRHLSQVKGGRLGALCAPARLITLVISDVPGDSLHDIASGPTVGDPTTCEQALEILTRYAIAIPPAIRQQLQQGVLETVKPGDHRLVQSQTHLIASPQMGLEAAAAYARSRGVDAHILSDRLEGEARDVGKILSALSAQVQWKGQPWRAPCVLLSGGETTVTVRGDGQGGRNVEGLLSFGMSLPHASPVHALFADTDGIDGARPVAGAFWRPGLMAKATQEGIRLQDALHRNDAHTFFEAMGTSLITGPTHTNINDFRAIWIPGT